MVVADEIDNNAALALGQSHYMGLTATPQLAWLSQQRDTLHLKNSKKG